MKNLRILKIALLLGLLSQSWATGLWAMGYGNSTTTDASSTTSLVTANQYCLFLNAVAATDYYHLYDDAMGCDQYTGCIVRLGEPGNFHYEVIAGRENMPIMYLNWFDEALYCNWLENRLQAAGNSLQEDCLETGVYALNAPNDVSLLTKNHEMPYFITDATVTIFSSASACSSISTLGLTPPDHCLKSNRSGLQAIHSTLLTLEPSPAMSSANELDEAIGIIGIIFVVGNVLLRGEVGAVEGREEASAASAQAEGKTGPGALMNAARKYPTRSLHIPLEEKIDGDETPLSESISPANNIELLQKESESSTEIIAAAEKKTWARRDNVPEHIADQWTHPLGEAEREKAPWAARVAKFIPVDDSSKEMKDISVSKPSSTDELSLNETEQQAQSLWQEAKKIESNSDTAREKALSTKTDDEKTFEEAWADAIQQEMATEASWEKVAQAYEAGRKNISQDGLAAWDDDLKLARYLKAHATTSIYWRRFQKEQKIADATLDQTNRVDPANQEIFEEAWSKAIQQAGTTKISCQELVQAYSKNREYVPEGKKAAWDENLALAKYWEAHYENQVLEREVYKNEPLIIAARARALALDPEESIAFEAFWNEATQLAEATRLLSIQVFHAYLDGKESVPKSEQANWEKNLGYARNNKNYFSVRASWLRAEKANKLVIAARNEAMASAPSVTAYFNATWNKAAHHASAAKAAWNEVVTLYVHHQENSSAYLTKLWNAYLLKACDQEHFHETLLPTFEVMKNFQRLLIDPSAAALQDGKLFQLTWKDAFEKIKASITALDHLFSDSFANRATISKNSQAVWDDDISRTEIQHTYYHAQAHTLATMAEAAWSNVVDKFAGDISTLMSGESFSLHEGEKLMDAMGKAEENKAYWAQEIAKLNDSDQPQKKIETAPQLKDSQKILSPDEISRKAIPLWLKVKSSKKAAKSASKKRDTVSFFNRSAFDTATIEATTTAKEAEAACKELLQAFDENKHLLPANKLESWKKDLLFTNFWQLYYAAEPSWFEAWKAQKIADAAQRKFLITPNTSEENILTVSAETLQEINAAKAAWDQVVQAYTNSRDLFPSDLSADKLETWDKNLTLASYWQTYYAVTPLWINAALTRKIAELARRNTFLINPDNAGAFEAARNDAVQKTELSESAWREFSLAHLNASHTISAKKEKDWDHFLQTCSREKESIILSQMFSPLTARQTAIATTEQKKTAPLISEDLDEQYYNKVLEAARGHFSMPAPIDEDDEPFIYKKLNKYHQEKPPTFETLQAAITAWNRVMSTVLVITEDHFNDHAEYRWAEAFAEAEAEKEYCVEQMEKLMNNSQKK